MDCQTGGLRSGRACSVEAAPVEVWLDGGVEDAEQLELAFRDTVSSGDANPHLVMSLDFSEEVGGVQDQHGRRLQLKSPSPSVRVFGQPERCFGLIPSRYVQRRQGCLVSSQVGDNGNDNGPHAEWSVLDIANEGTFGPGMLRIVCASDDPQEREELVLFVLDCCRPNVILMQLILQD